MYIPANCAHFIDSRPLIKVCGYSYDKMTRQSGHCCASSNSDYTNVILKVIKWASPTGWTQDLCKNSSFFIKFNKIMRTLRKIWTHLNLRVNWNSFSEDNVSEFENIKRNGFQVVSSKWVPYNWLSIVLMVTSSTTLNRSFTLIWADLKHSFNWIESEEYKYYYNFNNFTLSFQ